MAITEIAGIEATFGGVPLLGSAPIRWRIAEGVDPVIETFEVPIAALPFFEAKANRHEPQELVLQNRGVIGLEGNEQIGKVVRVKNLRIITAEPGPNPHIGRIQVGDIRWLFPYLRIWKQFNVRARLANRKRGVWGDDPQFVQDVSQDQYRRWSLNPETDQPWLALDIILDTLENPASGLNRDLLAGELTIVQFDEDVEELRGISLEDILLDDDGAGALRRALALLPGIGIYVDYDGNLRLFNKFNARMESEEARSIGPPIVDGGIITRISNSTTRPREVHCLFPRKVEVRFNYAPGLPEFAGEDDSRRLMENVILVVDPDFKDDDGNLVPQGTWLNADKYIAALAAQADAIGAARLKKFSKKILDQAQIPWMGIWSLIEAAGLDDLATTGGDTSKFQWASRFASLRTHYLQTFRLNPAWARRARLIEAKLVGIFDAETGTRAKSPVWADHAVVPGLKFLLVGGHSGKEFCLVTNQFNFPGSTEKGGPGDIDTPLKKDSVPSLFRVDVLDQDQGLIRITPRGDVYGNWDTILPAPVINRPCYNPEAGALESPLSFDSQLEGQKDDKISALNSAIARFAIVLTLVPATPNSTDQFHRIIVTPDDVKKVLPAGARRGLANAKGPIKELLIKDEVARVIWVDNAAAISITHRMFDLPEEGAADVRGVVAPVGREEAAAQTLNDPAGGVVDAPLLIGGGADLGKLALARAAQVYAAEQDRLMGASTGPLTPDVRPAGFLSEVIHTVETDGSMITHIQLPAAAPGIELEAFLDDFTRKRLNQELGAR